MHTPSRRCSRPARTSHSVPTPRSRRWTRSPDCTQPSPAARRPPEFRMKLIFIYGPPAVGKLTVATELAKITSFAVFDDHPAINSLQPVFGSLPQSMDKVVEQIRLAVIEEAARANADLIFTFVYTHPDDVPYVDRICDAVQRHGGEMRFVQLICAREAQEARVVHPDRSPFKSVDSVGVVRDWNAR